MNNFGWVDISLTSARKDYGNGLKGVVYYNITGNTYGYSLMHENKELDSSDSCTSQKQAKYHCDMVAKLQKVAK